MWIVTCKPCSRGRLAKLPPAADTEAAQNGLLVQSYVARSKQGAWPFEPTDNAGTKS
jgi:hypothetical protein